ncbi:hypothetical protein AGMMS49942_03620 [Spirochaetia bacterium]|nr:hypothetical protein AGMMS49942_03620 [Spirochaetia bacterium]
MPHRFPGVLQYLDLSKFGIQDRNISFGVARWRRNTVPFGDTSREMFMYGIIYKATGPTGNGPPRKNPPYSPGPIT